MIPQPRAAGFTLLEAMVAMAVLLLGATGLMSLHTMGVRMNGEARVVTRATVVGQDLLAQMQTWSFADPRLAMKSRTGTFADDDLVFTRDTLTTSDYDHTEDELAADWDGTPTAELAELGITRYWNVEDLLDAQGRTVGKQIAVIVCYGPSGARHRLVLLTLRNNPQASLM
jgi:type II secretory pathway pseudopilin PulG